jgi:L-amino acid N-acyltransferase YncA
VQAQITADNHASRALHENCGFREVGRRERYGHINDVWRDVILLEWRSRRVGSTVLPTRSSD